MPIQLSCLTSSSFKAVATAAVLPPVQSTAFATGSYKLQYPVEEVSHRRRATSVKLLLSPGDSSPFGVRSAAFPSINKRLSADDGVRTAGRRGQMWRIECWNAAHDSCCDSVCPPFLFRSPFIAESKNPDFPHRHPLSAAAIDWVQLVRTYHQQRRPPHPPRRSARRKTPVCSRDAEEW